jgi:sulfonate transport system substrate-binding protein
LSIFGRILAAFVALAVVFGPLRGSADAPKQLRIGYQKSSPLQILKEQGLLEKRFAAQGITVSWVEFTSGPPVLEALNAGAIDFGYTGDAPPIFAQSAGADLLYVASFPIPGHSSGIIVRNDSGIKTLADLRGKRIAVAKGSSGHNLLVRALERGGVQYSEIQPIYVQPAEGAAALQNGSADAWAIWDPYFGVGERFPGVHTLTTGYNLAPTNSFYFATREFAAHYPGVITAIVEELNHGAQWAKGHPQELASELAAQTGVPLDIQTVVAARGPYTYPTSLISDGVVRQQQSIADTFFKLGLIPQPVDVRKAVWHP